MFLIDISTHPRYNDITRKVSILDLVRDKYKGFIKLQCMVHHYKDGSEFKDLDRAIVLTLKNTEQYPNPFVPGTTIGDYDASCYKLMLVLKYIKTLLQGLLMHLTLKPIFQ